MARSRPRLSGLLRRAIPALLSGCDGHGSWARDGRMLQIGEEDADLALGRSERVAAVDEVLGEQDPEVAADGSWIGLTRVGGAHHGPHDLPGVLGALEHEGDDRAAAHERDEVV